MGRVTCWWKRGGGGGGGGGEEAIILTEKRNTRKIRKQVASLYPKRLTKREKSYKGNDIASDSPVAISLKMVNEYFKNEDW